MNGVSQLFHSIPLSTSDSIYCKQILESLYNISIFLDVVVVVVVVVGVVGVAVVVVVVVV